MEFGRSDPLTRAYLLRSAFSLLQCMSQRGFEVHSQLTLSLYISAGHALSVPVLSHSTCEHLKCPKDDICVLAETQMVMPAQLPEKPHLVVLTIHHLSTAGHSTGLSACWRARHAADHAVDHGQPFILPARPDGRAP